MTLAELKATLSAPAPPAGLSAALVALWHDAKGDWDAAHRVAQEVDDADGAWVHAYLHRKEGDEGNAAYWYRRARQPVPRAAMVDDPSTGSGSFEASSRHEWDTIAAALLARAPA
jgi:hypothetical protein